jgi:GT2 family glycosyltransferase
VDRVVVVDNASTDGSWTLFEAGGCHRDAESAEPGFAQPAIRAAGSRADCLLFLNPDTRVVSRPRAPVDYLSA